MTLFSSAGLSKDATTVSLRDVIYHKRRDCVRSTVGAPLLARSGVRPVRRERRPPPSCHPDRGTAVATAVPEAASLVLYQREGLSRPSGGTPSGSEKVMKIQKPHGGFNIDDNPDAIQKGSLRSVARDL